MRTYTYLYVRSILLSRNIPESAHGLLSLLLMVVIITIIIIIYNYRYNNPIILLTSVFWGFGLRRNK